MSFATRLVDLLRDVVSTDAGGSAVAASDVGLAAAALLVHVARIDGKIDAEEHRAIVGLLEADGGVSAEAAESLLARADRLDLEVDDVSTLVEMLGQGQDRRRLLSMAYEVAAADGIIHEFEDDLVWRMGHLLGFEDDAIAAVRAASVRPAASAEPVAEA